VQLERHRDVEPRALGGRRDDEPRADAVLLPALLEVLLLVDHAHADLVRALVVLAELEDAVPLPRVLRHDVQLRQVLQPDQRREHLDRALPQFGLAGEVLELADRVEHQHQLLVLLRLLLVDFDVALEFVALGDLDAEQNELVRVLLHPFAEGVGQVVAFVAALDPVLDVGFLLAELGHERGQFGVHVLADRVLQLLQPDLHVLLALQLHVFLLEADFLGVAADRGEHPHDFELGRALGHVFLDLHLVDPHEQLGDLLLDLLRVVRVADDPEQVLVRDEVEPVELRPDLAQLVLDLLEPLLEPLVEFGEVLGQLRGREHFLDALPRPDVLDQVEEVALLVPERALDRVEHLVRVLHQTERLLEVELVLLHHQQELERVDDVRQLLLPEFDVLHEELLVARDFVGSQELRVLLEHDLELLVLGDLEVDCLSFVVLGLVELERNGLPLEPDVFDAVFDFLFVFRLFGDLFDAPVVRDQLGS